MAKKTALLETFKKRPDLIDVQELTIEESGLLQEALSEQEQDLKKEEIDMTNIIQTIEKEEIARLGKKFRSLLR